MKLYQKKISHAEKLDKSIIAALTNGSMWKNIELKETVDSTNTFLKHKSDLKCGDVIIAETQTEGRGRRGRTWFSPQGNLYMSVCVNADGSFEKASLVGLTMAVAATETISSLGIDCKIKWPNDIVINGRKVCGILSETAVTQKNNLFCIVGIGINTEISHFSEEVINPAVSLRDVHNEKIDINKFTADLLLTFEKYLNNANMIEKYRKYCVNIGRTVKIADGGNEYTAEAVDIGENGNLIIKTKSGYAAVNSGEVSVRGIYGYCD